MFTVRIGFLAGTIYGNMLPWRFSTGVELPAVLADIESFAGVRFVVWTLLYHALSALFICLATFCVLVVLRALLRNQVAAIAFGVVFMSLAAGPQFGFEAILIYGALWFFVLMRFGFLAAVLVEFAFLVVIYYPFTLVSSAWYADYGYLVLAIFAVIVLYAFRTSLGGRPLISAPQLDD